MTPSQPSPDANGIPKADITVTYKRPFVESPLAEDHISLLKCFVQPLVCFAYIELSHQQTEDISDLILKLPFSKILRVIHDAEERKHIFAAAKKHVELKSKEQSAKAGEQAKGAKMGQTASTEVPTANEGEKSAPEKPTLGTPLKNDNAATAPEAIRTPAAALLSRPVATLGSLDKEVTASPNVTHMAEAKTLHEQPSELPKPAQSEPKMSTSSSSKSLAPARAKLPMSSSTPLHVPLPAGFSSQGKPTKLAESQFDQSTQTRPKLPAKGPSSMLQAAQAKVPAPPKTDIQVTPTTTLFSNLPQARQSTAGPESNAEESAKQILFTSAVQTLKDHGLYDPMGLYGRTLKEMRAAAEHRIKLAEAQNHHTKQVEAAYREHQLRNLENRRSALKVHLEVLDKCVKGVQIAKPEMLSEVMDPLWESMTAVLVAKKDLQDEIDMVWKREAEIVAEADNVLIKAKGLEEQLIGNVNQLSINMLNVINNLPKAD